MLLDNVMVDSDLGVMLEGAGHLPGESLDLSVVVTLGSFSYMDYDSRSFKPVCR